MLFEYLPLEKCVVLHLNKLESPPLSSGILIALLVEIGSLALEKKILKTSSMYFHYFVNIPLGKRLGLSVEQTGITFTHVKDALCHFGRNWPSYSREKVENVKSYRRTDRQMTDDQKSSLERSAQMS